MDCDFFERQLIQALLNCNVSLNNAETRLGVAVSGGADSVSLLIGLSQVLKAYKLPLFVITVNHNIRASEETCGDAAFVQSLCSKLKKDGFDIHFELFEIERGLVNSTAEMRKNGIEEAARFLRYKAFDSFIADNKLDFLCLAHNSNDNLETILMRFLQGSGSCGLSGIEAVRGKYIRPLLNIERSQIEEYLAQKNQSYRTDSTNFDDSYLRNNIRLNLIPLLNEKFDGWKKAVINGAQKASLEKEVIENKLKKISVLQHENEVFISCKEFFSVEVALQIKLLLKACSVLGVKERVPFSFLKDVCCGLSSGKCENKIFSNIEISCKNNLVIVKKSVKLQTDFVFSDIIYKKGIYNFKYGSIEFVPEKTADNSEETKLFSIYEEGQCILENIHLPVYVRSVMPDDVIKSKDGAMKKVGEILENWHVPKEQRPCIPVIQTLYCENQKIICILGKAAGFNNWIVK